MKHFTILISILSIFLLTACSGRGENSEQTDAIDIDLTTMSSTMVYTQVFSLLSEPENYLDQTMKMSGIFAYYHDEATDINHYAVIVKDALGCCAQGIEFTLTNESELSFPDDYPEPGDIVTVVGKFNIYSPPNSIIDQYCRLEQAEFIG